MMTTRIEKLLNIIRKKPLSSLFFISLVMAFLSHLFFLSEWLDGRYMTGMNDGLSQMLPFKKLLYDAYTSGNFFYSNQFGMGGGIYSQLSYYFSTSIIFILTLVVTFLLESLHLIQEPDLFYWADLILVVSIFRLTLITFVTTLLFRYMNIQMIPAFIGALTYGTSIIYFRHVTYWDFFTDAMLWLPLLLIGIEKVIRERKIGLFIVAVAISLFDNFYFAYINFLVAGLYIFFRWIIPLSAHETRKIAQFKMYMIGGLAGFGISAISFIPAVYGYLNNHRIPFEQPIPFWGIPDNLLVDSRIVSLPAFVILCLFVFSFYKNKLFKFFACLTILSVMMHFSPMVASTFNGFSAPQYRWEYFLSLAAGGIVAMGLQQIQTITKRQAVITIFCSLIIYVISYHTQEGFFFVIQQEFSIFTLKVAYLVIAAILTVIFFTLYTWKKDRMTFTTFTVFLVIISLYTSNIYQMVKLPNTDHKQAVSKEFMQSDHYNGEDQLKLIRKILEREHDSFFRIDWMTETRNNTPIVQNFNGFSVYSSILNKNLLSYYLYDLEIDMGRESVSRYMTLGDRANLYSILGGKYLIAEKGKKTIPYQFEKIFSEGNYTAYENKNSLPFFRTTNSTFLERDFNDSSAIAKERAMITGIILNEEKFIKKKEQVPQSLNVIDDLAIETKDATYEKNQLHVNAASGGIDLRLNQPHTQQDYYISFYLKRLNQDKGYTLRVNDYATSRKKNSSIYKTGVDRLTIRVSAKDKISLRLPKGQYELSDIALYAEDYETLKLAKQISNQKPYIPIHWEGNKVKIMYHNDANERFATLPIPYEKGWTLSINGQKSELLQANYAFIGMMLEDGDNDIELVYYPPYFLLSTFLTALTLILTIFFLIRRK